MVGSNGPVGVLSWEHFMKIRFTLAASCVGNPAIIGMIP
jgi:hypothetical protein